MAPPDKLTPRIKALRESALVLVQAHKYEAAAVEYKQLIKIDPEDGDWAKRAADCYWQLKQTDQRFKYSRLAAETYAEAGLILKAVAMCKVALAINPHHDETLELIASLSSKLEANAQKPPPAGVRRVAAPQALQESPATGNSPPKRPRGSLLSRLSQARAVPEPVQVQPQRDDDGPKRRARMAAAAALRALRAQKPQAGSDYVAPPAGASPAPTITSEGEQSPSTQTTRLDRSSKPELAAEERASVDTPVITGSPAAPSSDVPPPRSPLAPDPVRAAARFPFLSGRELQVILKSAPPSDGFVVDPQQAPSAIPSLLVPAGPSRANAFMPASVPTVANAASAGVPDLSAKSPALVPSLWVPGTDPDSYRPLDSFRLSMWVPADTRTAPQSDSPESFGGGIYALNLERVSETSLGDAPLPQIELSPDFEPFYETGTLAKAPSSRPLDGSHPDDSTEVISTAVISTDFISTELISTRVTSSEVIEAAAANTSPPHADPHDLDVVHHALETIPLLSKLRPELLQQLILEVELVELGAHEVLFNQGDIADAMYVIVEGSVVAMTAPHGDRPIELARLEEGEFFGEIGLLSDQPRQAGVSALEPSRLLRFDRQTVGRLIDSEPGFLEVLLQFLKERLVEDLMLTSPLFAPFSENERRELADYFEFLEIDPQSLLVDVGQPPIGMYVLLTGEALLTGTDTERTLGPGDVFGEQALLHGELSRIRVVASVKCFAICLPSDAFSEVIMTHPTILEYLSGLTDEEKGERHLGDDFLDHMTFF